MIQATSSPHRDTASAMSGGQLPLTGITVVDLTSAVVGPYCTQILADYGAEVIKVEERSGDIIRWITGKSPTPGMSGKFMHMNRNKRSVSLDLKKPGAREALLKLVAKADVFIHNMRPAAIGRLGLDAQSLRELNPSIVYCGVVGFGQDGRYRSRPAYDSILQGGTGLASLFAANGGDPRYVPFVVIDRMAGLMVVHSVLAALFARQRDGEGREIEVPMFESFAALMLSEHLYGSSFDPPVSPPGDSRLLDANAKPIKTLDGFICVTTNTDAQVLALFDAFDAPELKADKRFNTAAARIEHISEFFALRARYMALHTTAEWTQRLDRHDIPSMPCHTLESLLNDEHLNDVGLLQPTEHQTQGTVLSIRVPFRMTGFQPSVRHPAPEIGQDTRDVLGELGYSPEAIQELVQSGAAFEGSRAG